MRCSREGCENKFDARAQKRFCSKRCRQNAHGRRHPDLRAARDARYLHATGWYVRYKQRLGRRIHQRLEEVG